MFNKKIKMFIATIATIAVVGSAVPGVEAYAATQFEKDNVSYSISNDYSSATLNVLDSGVSGNITIPENFQYDYTDALNPDNNHTYTVTVNGDIPTVFAYGCTGLTGITIETDKVQSIGNAAFNGCTSLTSASLNNVKSIGSYAFKDCKLGDVNGYYEVPDTVTSIGIDTFSNENTDGKQSVIKVPVFASAMTGMHKVEFKSEGNTVYRYYVKDGAHMVDSQIQAAPVTGMDWDSTALTSVKSSVTADIVVNAVVNTTIPASDITLLDTSGNNFVLNNRQNAVCEVNPNNMSSVYTKYYYTIDGTDPTPSNGTLLDKNNPKITITAPDSDDSQIITLKVAEYYAGSLNGTVKTQLVRFKAITYNVRFVDRKGYLIATKSIERGASAQDEGEAVKSLINDPGYTFDYWQSVSGIDIWNITGEATFKAVMVQGSGSGSGTGTGGTGSGSGTGSGTTTSITAPNLNPTYYNGNAAAGGFGGKTIYHSTNNTNGEIDARFIRTGENQFVLAYCAHSDSDASSNYHSNIYTGVDGTSYVYDSTTGYFKVS